MEQRVDAYESARSSAWTREPARPQLPSSMKPIVTRKTLASDRRLRMPRARLNRPTTMSPRTAGAVMRPTTSPALSAWAGARTPARNMFSRSRRAPTASRIQGDFSTGVPAVLIESSSFRRLFPGDVRHEQALDRRTLLQVRAHDLRQVGLGHAGVPDVGGMDGHRDAAAAVLEAVRAVDDHGQAAL